jgi:hypothetical protein
MKSGQLFWGFFLLSIGALFLLIKYNIIYSEFYFVWDLWPLIFVLWGALVIFKNSLVRPFISALFGIFLALMLFGIISNFYTGFHLDFDVADNEFISQNFSEDYNDSAKTSFLELRTGGGIFEIKDTTDKLIEGTAYGSFAEYDFNSKLENEHAFVELNLHKKDFNPFEGRIKNHLVLALNNNPIWNFKFDFGAAKAKFDLSPYKVNNVELNTGAANVKMKLGDKKDSTFVDVEMGAAKLKFDVPENSGCQVKSKMVLSSRSFSGFEKKDRGYYETPGFENAKKKIFIRINGGVSSLSINRY